MLYFLTEVILLFKDCVEVEQVVDELRGEDLLLEAGRKVVLRLKHDIDVGKLVQEFQVLVQKEYPRTVRFLQTRVQA